MMVPTPPRSGVNSLRRRRRVARHQHLQSKRWSVSFPIWVLTPNTSRRLDHVKLPVRCQPKDLGIGTHYLHDITPTVSGVCQRGFRHERRAVKGSDAEGAQPHSPSLRLCPLPLGLTDKTYSIGLSCNMAASAGKEE
jgi:hypothetical protein